MQNSRETVRRFGSTRVTNYRQKSHKQGRIPKQAVETLEPVLIESCEDRRISKFLNTQEEEARKTQEETEWETYEDGWREGYQSGISDSGTFAQARAKTKKKRIPYALST